MQHDFWFCIAHRIDKALGIADINDTVGYSVLYIGKREQVRLRRRRQCEAADPRA